MYDLSETQTGGNFMKNKTEKLQDELSDLLNEANETLQLPCDASSQRTPLEILALQEAFYFLSMPGIRDAVHDELSISLENVPEN